MLALEHEPRLKERFAWNDFRHRVEVCGRTPWCQPEWWGAASLTPTGNRALRDADLAGLGAYLTGTYDFGACSMTIARAALHAVAEAHLFDELLDWIEALPEWDGTARLDGWLVTYAGADTEVHSKEYLALIGAKYLMQVLNRALHPGAKADYALAFTAGQGAYKDQILADDVHALLPRGHPVAAGLTRRLRARPRRGDRRPRRRDGGLAQGRYRGSEGGADALRRPGRRAYGYEARDYPRRTCLAFTTNDVDFLQDATGDRRYWPLQQSSATWSTSRPCAAIAIRFSPRPCSGCGPGSGIGRRPKRKSGSSNPSGGGSCRKWRWRSSRSCSASSSRSR